MPSNPNHSQFLGLLAQSPPLPKSCLPVHRTHHRSSLRVQTGWVVGTEGLKKQTEESGLRPRVLPSASSSRNVGRIEFSCRGLR